MSTAFPSIEERTVGAELPFQAPCRLCKADMEVPYENTCPLLTSVSKRWEASAKKSSDTETTEPPSEALESSSGERRHVYVCLL